MSRANEIVFSLLFQHVGRNNILKQAMVYKKYCSIWVAKPFLLEDPGRVRCSDGVVSVVVYG